jgi:uncharacterized protein YndB with AHSA1/START domain
MGKTEFVIEPGRQDIVMTRVFDAPPDVVFRALTDPDIIPNWWGPNAYETIVDHAEPRSGGRWRFRHRDTDGTEYAFKGIYHDVVPGERVIQTFEYEGVPGHVALETMTLEDVGGRTHYRTVSVFQSIEDRDAMVASGMEGGASETMDRLAEIVEKR